VLEVDVSKVMRGPAFAEIRKPEVFCKVHTDGSSIEWFDTELGPDNVYAWAKEQADEVSHEMFGAWLHRNKLSLFGVAEALGISRRMVSYYRTAHKAIPRSIWLACLGWDAIGFQTNEDHQFATRSWRSFRDGHESNALRSGCRPFATDANSLLGGEGFVCESTARDAFIGQKVSALPT